MRKGQIGIHLDTHNGPYNQPPPTRETVLDFTDTLMREVDTAEKAGFAYIGVSDRHARTETHFPSHLILCALLAARTQRATIGTWCTVLTLHNPYQYAEDTAMIDLLSKGRFIPTVGVGYHDDYWRGFGIPKQGRDRRFDEALQVLKLAWTEETFSFQGKYFTYDEARLTPKPYQQPRPPIWIGAQFEKSIARAGREGDAWGVDPFPLQPELWKRQVDIYKEAAIKAGREPYIVLMRDGFVAPTREEAYQTYGQYVLSELLFYYHQGILSHHPDFRSESDFTIDRIKNHLILGSPQDCIESLEKYRTEYEADSFILRFRTPLGPAHDTVLDCLRLFGEEVLPHFHTG